MPAFQSLTRIYHGRLRPVVEKTVERFLECGIFCHGLRAAFRRDRRLLGELSRCAWKALQDSDQAVPGEGWAPGAIVSIQTYGDELNWHPHLHSVLSDAACDPRGNPRPLRGADSETLARLFQEHVLQMLVSERRLSREFTHRLRSWRRPRVLLTSVHS